MAVSPSTVLRVRGLPRGRNINEVTSLIERSLQIRPEASGLKITSLAEDPYQLKGQVATLMFLAKIPPLFTTSTIREWSVNVSEAGCSLESDGGLALTFDTHFRGLTALNTPRLEEAAVDCVAVCGLGGHAFGSFKEKGTSYMWLRDSLPKDLPNLRVLLYGYESGLEESDSNQNISVIADSFVSHLSFLRPRSKPISTPLVIVAHSLGGLVVKQAIIKLAHGNESDKMQMESVVGLLFFGVPNRGMDIESLQAIVGDKQNRYLLESVGQYSDLLLQQDGQFGSTFHFKDTHVVSYFETKSSHTAIKVNGLWKMAGPKKVLVNRFSATRPRLWDSEKYDESLDRTHSDLVKFSVNDVDYERVHRRLREVASEATATLTSRYLTHESPDSLDADVEACLRSLSFTEIYARESLIEQAVQDTGSWLLESQNFQEWSQRTKLDKHRGIFWIQGNPGSGKSTLMKKIYSHVMACEKNPSSVVAAFFFNARGAEMEKSPTGLLRTLLHTICQRIAAIRNTVVKAYTAKNKLIKPGWQWQINELKEFLAAAVKSSVLGKRRLILFIDALDECDSTATQSVIRVFEDLARYSISEGTNFNVCLSSRYWPQIRVQHCFVARVELENEGDIVTYIREHLDSTQKNKELEVLSCLRSEILDKAKGTFLWVVLVLRELLNASVAGATLRELRSIVQRVPSDINKFYQHQLQSTESKDRDHMLRLLQLVFYAQRPLSPTELRYALAFGCREFASYAEWSQSSDYVRSDEQMEKRIREHSRGLVEIAQLPGDDAHSQDSDDDQSRARSSQAVVQFIHQSVRDFLKADGFSFLRDIRQHTHDADGHEFFKTACWNYLKIKDFEAISTVNLRISTQFEEGRESMKPEKDHPLLKYMVEYIFLHAAQAEQHGISQDRFRTYICGNRGCFERWNCLHDAVIDDPDEFLQGPNTRPIHVLAQYGLLTREIAQKERNIDIVGGAYGSALIAACWSGHQDAVEILLDLGADPKLENLQFGSRPGSSRVWARSMAPIRCAIERRNLPVLRQILNQERSCFTLRERLKSVKFLYDSDEVGAILVLLFPETTFPDSAIDDLCEVVSSGSNTVFSFVLDKFDKSIVHEERLWRIVLSSPNRSNGAIKVLLDRGGRIRITGTLIQHVHGNADELFALLLKHCDAEITEDLIDHISRFEDSSQIIHTFKAKGYRLGPFTSKQLLSALESGTAETAAFFLENHAGNTSANEMMTSAASNRLHGEEVTRILLGHLNPDHINEQVMIAALGNRFCCGNVMTLFHNQWGRLPYSEAALAAAVRNQSPNVVKLVLERSEAVRVTEEILNAASFNYFDRCAVELFELFFLHDPDIRIQESTVLAAIYNEDEGPDMLRMFCRHEKPLLCTELTVAAAARSPKGPDALEIVLQQDHGARISDSMIMETMRAERGAALISLMLDHDHSLEIREEHLVAAAAWNPYDPSTIFAFLRTRGKLDNTNLTSDVLDSHPAKRRRIYPESLARISTKVIDAAFHNREERPRVRLLELFLEWGVITAADYDSRMDLDYTS